MFDDVCVSLDLTSVISVCHQRGGGVAALCECESVFAYSVRVVSPSACVLPDPCVTAIGPNLPAEEFFPAIPCGTSNALMCSASVK